MPFARVDELLETVVMTIGLVVVPRALPSSVEYW
jgi:hypothetical protein